MNNFKKKSDPKFTRCTWEIRTWNELLQFVGGQLEMDKNTWYLIEWDFDANDTPYIKEQNQPLNFLDDKGWKIPFKQLQPNEPATYLGLNHRLIDPRKHSIANFLQRQNRVREVYQPHTCLTIIHMSIINVLSSQE